MDKFQGNQTTNPIIIHMLYLSYVILSASCTLSQRKAIERKLHPEAELHCTLHFTAPYLQLNILQAVFEASPHYDPNTGNAHALLSLYTWLSRVTIQTRCTLPLPLLHSLQVHTAVGFLSSPRRSLFSRCSLLSLSLSLSQPLWGASLPSLSSHCCLCRSLSLATRWSCPICQHSTAPCRPCPWLAHSPEPSSLWWAPRTCFHPSRWVTLKHKTHTPSF